MKLPFFNRLFTRIVILLMLLFFVAMGVHAWQFVRLEVAWRTEEIVNNGLVFAELNAPVMYHDFLMASGEGPLSFQALAKERLAKNPDIIRATMIGVNGRVVFDSNDFDRVAQTGRMAAGEDRFIDDVEVLAQVAKTTLNQREVVGADGKKLVEIVTPIIEVGGGHAFSVRYLLSFDSLERAKLELYWQVVAISLPLLVLIVVVGVFWSLSITRPIEKLSEAMRKIREGNLMASVPVVGNDEIGQLAIEFNQMGSRLQASYDDLEVRVKQRTDSLAANVTAMSDNKSAMLNLLEDSKELEESLRQERERMDLVIASMGDGLVVVDAEGKIVLINSMAMRLLEITEAKEVVGKSWFEVATAVVGSEQIPQAERILSAVLRDGIQTTLKLDDNLYYKTRSGKVFPVTHIIAPLLREGKVAGAVEVFRDATTEKESRSIIEKEVALRTAELRQEQARLTAAINSVPGGLAILDTAGQVLMANVRLADILGLKSLAGGVEVIAPILQSAVDFKKDFAECTAKRLAIVKKGQAVDHHFLDLYLVPIVLPNADVSGILFLVYDVTEEKVIDRSKDEFFSIASHELRTPLTAIKGNAAMIRDMILPKVNNPELSEMVTDIHEGSVRLIQIVNDFLDLSRLEMGKMLFKPEPVDVVALIKDVVRQYSAAGSLKQLSLEFGEPQTAVPLVMIDKNRAAQVLVNLIGNSFKFTKEGGVAVTIGEVTTDFVKVLVTDTGIGIDSENQKLLFRKFQQAESNILTRDVTQGTGLGLYISRLMMEGMKGQINLERSEMGKGSTFSISLPVSRIPVANIEMKK